LTAGRVPGACPGDPGGPFDKARPGY